MRKLVRSSMAITLSLILASLSAALTYSAPSPLQEKFSSAAMFLQTTPTPQEDASEIGSTDGIILMGGVIALIIVAPIFLRRKSWRQT